MTGVTTGQLALPTATDSDDVEAYLAAPGGLVTALQTFDNKFHSSTGHNHDATGEGAPILAGGIADGAITPAKLGATAFTAFAPSMTQNAGLTLSVAAGRYLQLGKLVMGVINVTINSAGTSGQPLIVTGLPVSGQLNGSPASGYYSRTGGIIYPIVAVWNTATTIAFYGGNGTGLLGVNPAFAAAVGDLVGLNFWYEAP